MNILVTGGAGFIGSRLIRYLLAVDSSNCVRVLDNFSTGKFSNLLPLLKYMDTSDQRLTIIKGDVCKFTDCGKACDGVQVVYHLAALKSVHESFHMPIEYNEVNINGTIRMLEAAHQRGVKRFVLASSAAVYGNSGSEIQSECDTLTPLSPYAVTKVAGENYCRTYNEKFGISTVALRFFNVYGPGQDPNDSYSGVISKFIKCLRLGGEPVIYGTGDQSRDFIHVDDVAKALVAAGQYRDEKYQVFNIGYGQHRSIKRLLEILEIIFNKRVYPAFTAPVKGDIQYSCADIHAAKLILGWRPTISLGKGLSQTVQQIQAEEY